MKKINFKRFLKYFMLLTISSCFSEFGIGCFYACELGSDPISVFVEGLTKVLPMTIGQISTMCNVILIILIFFFERKRLGLATIIAVLFAGPLIDFFVVLLRSTFPAMTTSIIVRVGLMITGTLSYGFGLGLAIATAQGIGCFSFPPLFLTDTFHIDLKYTQIITDAMFFVIGMLMGGIWGIGTLVGVFCTGPVLDWTLKKFAPVFEKIGPIFES